MGRREEQLCSLVINGAEFDVVACVYSPRDLMFCSRVCRWDNYVLWCEKSTPWQQASSHQSILFTDKVLWIAMSRSHRLHGLCAVCTCRTREHTPGVWCTPFYCTKYFVSGATPVLDRCCCLRHSLQFAIFWTWNILLTGENTFLAGRWSHAQDSVSFLF